MRWRFGRRGVFFLRVTRQSEQLGIQIVRHCDNFLNRVIPCDNALYITPYSNTLNMTLLISLSVIYSLVTRSCLGDMGSGKVSQKSSKSVQKCDFCLRVGKGGSKHFSEKNENEEKSCVAIKRVSGRRKLASAVDS